MDDDAPGETPSVPALPGREKRDSRKYTRTGRQTGVKGVVAAALLRDGQSITQVAAASGLHRDTVAAIRNRWGEGLKHVEQIRTVIRDLGVLTAAELLFGISERDIQNMPIEKRLDAAAKFLDRYAAPERANPNPFMAFFTQYNIQPSHSASKPTVISPESADTSKAS